MRAVGFRKDDEVIRVHGLIIEISILRAIDFYIRLDELFLSRQSPCGVGGLRCNFPSCMMRPNYCA
jgi:hypothetical protein